MSDKVVHEWDGMYRVVLKDGYYVAQYKTGAVGWMDADDHETTIEAELARLAQRVKELEQGLIKCPRCENGKIHLGYDGPPAAICRVCNGSGWIQINQIEEALVSGWEEDKKIITKLKERVKELKAVAEAATMTDDEIREIKEEAKYDLDAPNRLARIGIPFTQEDIEYADQQAEKSDIILALIAALEKERKENIQWQDKCLDLEIEYGRERRAAERLAEYLAKAGISTPTGGMGTKNRWLKLAREDEDDAVGKAD
jgi:RecJ-like exonuclease